MPYCRDHEPIVHIVFQTHTRGEMAHLVYMPTDGYLRIVELPPTIIDSGPISHFGVTMADMISTSVNKLSKNHIKLPLVIIT